MKALSKSRSVRRLGSTIVAPALWLSVGIAVGILFQSSRHRNDVPNIFSAPRHEVKSEQNKSGIQQTIAAGLEPALISPLHRLRVLTASRDAFDFAEVSLLIRSLQPADCKDAAKLIRRLPGDEIRGLLNALAKHWANIDPAGAFSAAESERHDNDWRNRLGYPAGAALAAINPEGALHRITSARNNDLREKTAEWVLPALANADPHRAAGYLLTNRFLHRHHHIFRNVATEFARVSPQDAMAWAETAAAQPGVQDKKGFRDSLMVNVWSGWAGKDPVACAAAISRTPETKHHENVFASVAQAWSKNDIFAALNWAESLPDENSRSAALRSMALNYHELGPDRARQFLSGVNSEQVRAEYAARFAHQLAQEDMQSALSWAQSLPEGTARSKALEPVFNEWALNDPASASQHIAAMPEFKERSGFLRRAVEQWTQGDPHKAFAFIQQLPAGESRDQAVAVAINSIRQDHPHTALEWYRTIDDPRAKAGVAAELVSSLINTDRTTALQLATELPPEAQPDTYKRLVRLWAFDKAKEAGEWIKDLPSGKPRDAAVEAYVSVIDGVDPALATQWAYSIQDPVNRMESVFKAFHRWIEKDRAGAVSWVEQTEIPDGLRPIFDRLLVDKDFFD